MSDWQVNLEFEEGTSSKFWRAKVEKNTLFVNYGRIGSTGQTQVKDFPSADAAQRELDKLVKEKRKKGYADPAGGGAGAGAAGAVSDDDDDDGDGDDDDDDAAPAKPSGLAALAAAAASAGEEEGIKLVLKTGGRDVVTRLVLDGKTVRMDAVETYASPEAAKKAHDRLKKALIGEGYKES